MTGRRYSKDDAETQRCGDTDENGSYRTTSPSTSKTMLDHAKYHAAGLAVERDNAAPGSLMARTAAEDNETVWCTGSLARAGLNGSS